MESEGAKRVFEQSIENYNLRYVEFLGDGIEVFPMLKKLIQV